MSGVSSAFGLARTQSGATFAAWVTSSSEGTYALESLRISGELPMWYCGRTETRGTGTAELVVARVTESEPAYTHFRFEMGGAGSAQTREVVMVARGDTLVVVTYITGSKIPTMTYLEIDSTRLP